MKTTDLNYASYIVSKGIMIKDVIIKNKQGIFIFDDNDNIPTEHEFFNTNNVCYKFCQAIRMLKSLVKNGGQKEVSS